MSTLRYTAVAVFTFCVGAEAVAQAMFNRRFDPTGNYLAELAWSVEACDSGYMVFGNGDWIWAEDSITYYTSSVLWNLRLDANGAQLDQYLYWDSATADYPGIANSAIQLSSGTYVVGGGNYQMDGTQAPLLYFINGQGAVDSVKVFGIQGEEWIGRQVKQCRDGRFALAGNYGTPAIADGFLIMADPTGEQDWVQTYGGPGVDAITALDTIGTQIYLGGQWNVFGGNAQMWMLRVDEVGAIVWQMTWGGPFDDHLAMVSTLANGHALVASGWANAPNYGQMRPYMAVLDSVDGSILWERQYDAPASEATLWTAKEMAPGGDLIAVGQSNLAAPMRGILLHTTNQGDSIWMRYYEYSDSVVNRGRGVLRDVMPTTDGGFIAVGSAGGLSNDPNDPPAYSQDMWVIKTDSLGCLVPGCDLITGLSSQVTNLREALTLWPNPTAGPLEVKIALPGSGPTEGPLRLVVTSLDGRLIQERNLPAERHQQVRLDLGQEAAGLYSVHLVEVGRWLAGVKVVVE